MLEDGDRVLDLVGVLLVIAVLGGLGIIAVGIANPGPDPQPTPEANFTFERVNESQVRITHAGGPPVAAADLLVIVDGLERNPGWESNVGEDDTGLVLATEGATVTVYWDGGRADKRVLSKSQV
jgi:hypothetical protein